MSLSGGGPAGAEDGYQPDQDVVDDVWTYARETNNGFDHVLRWMRVMKTFGVVKDMTAAAATPAPSRRSTPGPAPTTQSSTAC